MTIKNGLFAGRALNPVEMKKSELDAQTQSSERIFMSVAASARPAARYLATIDGTVGLVIRDSIRPRRHRAVNWECHSNLKVGLGITGSSQICSPVRRNLIAHIIHDRCRSRLIEREHQSRQSLVRIDSTGEAPPFTSVCLHVAQQRLVIRDDLTASCDPDRSAFSFIDHLSCRSFWIDHDQAFDSQRLYDRISIELRSLTGITGARTGLCGLAVAHRQIKRDRAFAVLREKWKAPFHSGFNIRLSDTEFLSSSPLVEAGCFCLTLFDPARTARRFLSKRPTSRIGCLSGRIVFRSAFPYWKMATKRKNGQKRTRPAIPRFGGKFLLCRRIIDLFPAHRTYLEPFGGGASVLLNKPPSPVEAYNDLDLQVTGIFQVLQKHGTEFVRRLKLVPYSEVEFTQAETQEGSEIDKAVASFIRLRQSFAAIGRSWRFSRSSSAGGMAKVVNHWWSAIDALPQIIERLRRVQITCQPAIDFIRRFDSEESLIYCDPPYVHGTRAKGSRDVYAIEMTDEDHEELARVLHACKGKVIVSGYPSKFYSRLYRGWRTKRFTVSKHCMTARRKPRATECLWMNF